MCRTKVPSYPGTNTETGTGAIIYGGIDIVYGAQRTEFTIVTCYMFLWTGTSGAADGHTTDEF